MAIKKEPKRATEETAEEARKEHFGVTKEIIERAKRDLAGLTGFKDPAATGFKEEDNQLIVTIEVVEKKSIPDGMDVLGTYEVRVNDSGRIIDYERTNLRKRGDTNLSKEA